MARKVTGNVAESAIQTDRLSRDFNGLRAVDELTLRVPAGSIFGFLGPNGAGKTTTLRLLLGLLEPSSGSAEVLGHDTRSGACRIRERAGALLEHSGLYERLSAEDNLEFYGRVYRLGPSFVRPASGTGDGSSERESPGDRRPEGPVDRISLQPRLGPGRGRQGGPCQSEPVDRPVGSPELALVGLFASQEVELAPAVLDRPTDQIRQQHPTR